MDPLQQVYKFIGPLAGHTYLFVNKGFMIFFNLSYLSLLSIFLWQLIICSINHFIHLSKHFLVLVYLWIMSSLFCLFFFKKIKLWAMLFICGIATCKEFCKNLTLQPGRERTIVSTLYFSVWLPNQWISTGLDRSLAMMKNYV